MENFCVVLMIEYELEKNNLTKKIVNYQNKNIEKNV